MSEQNLKAIECFTEIISISGDLNPMWSVQNGIFQPLNTLLLAVPSTMPKNLRTTKKILLTVIEVLSP